MSDDYALLWFRCFTPSIILRSTLALFSCIIKALGLWQNSRKLNGFNLFILRLWKEPDQNPSMRTVSASTFSCALPRRHRKTTLTSANVVPRRALLPRVVHGAGRGLIKNIAAHCALSILTFFFSSPLTAVTSTNHIEQVWKNKETWILSLFCLHRLFLWWEMIRKRVVTLLHIKHLIYTALDQQR